MKEERWHKLVGLEGIPDMPDCEVSTLGRVRKGNHILPQYISDRGYMKVHIWDAKLFASKRRRNFRVHRLVALAFIPNLLKLATVDHRDEDKTNNHVDNLRWLSSADNSYYANNKIKKSDLVKIRLMRVDGLCHQQIAERFGVDRTTIGRALNRKREYAR